MKWLIAVVLLALAAGAVSVWLGQHEAGGLFGLLAASALGGAGKLKRTGQKAAKEKRRELDAQSDAAVAAGSPVAGEHDSARADRHQSDAGSVDRAADLYRDRVSGSGGDSIAEVEAETIADLQIECAALLSARDDACVQTLRETRGDDADDV